MRVGALQAGDLRWDEVIRQHQLTRKVTGSINSNLAIIVPANYNLVFAGLKSGTKLVLILPADGTVS